MDRETQTALGSAFLERHHEPGVVVLPNAWDVASALLLAQAGFEAIATTSAGIGYSSGYPVGEKMPLDDMLDAVVRMTRRLAVPLSVDMESGYGVRLDEIAQTVSKTIEAGAVGINIEDTCHDGSKQLFEFPLAVDRIAAARAAADDSGIPFVVNARTDGYWNGGESAAVHDDVVARANAFRAAGADCIFVPGVMDADIIGRLAREIDAPLNVMAGSSTPPVAELDALGVRRLTVGAMFARAAYRRLEQAAQELRDHGTYGFANDIASHATLNALMSDG